MSFKGVAMVLFLFVLGIAFSGFAAYQNTLMDHKEEVTIDGKKLAQQNCAGCHGKDLKGDKGPNLHERGALLSEETVMQIVKDGIGGNMPAIPLNDKEIAAVAKYITTMDSAK